MQKHSIENLRFAHGKFSKIVNSWTERIIYI